MERPPRRLRVVGDPAPASAPASAPAPFERVAIVGLDGVGAAIGLAARAAWPAALVIGVDRNDVLERAMRLHVMDVASSDLVLASQADLVLLAGTPEANLAALGALAGVVAGEAVVSPVGSRIEPLAAAARALPPRLTPVFGHPQLQAWPRSIEEAAGLRLDRLEWWLVPCDDAGAAAARRLVSFVEGLGASPRLVAFADHDRNASGGGGWNGPDR